MFYDVKETAVEVLAISPKSRVQEWSGSTKRPPRARRVALARVKDDLSRYLRLAADEEIVIADTRSR